MKNNTIEIDQKIVSGNETNKGLSALDIDNPTRRPLTAPITISKPSSSAFDLELALNPLVAAATPLLTVCSKLQNSEQNPNYQQLHKALVHEIKVFEEKTRKLDYRSAIILAARYFLCAYIDETISKQPALKTDWQTNPLLSVMQGEKWGGERFFLILERASDDSKVHIDLLELGFLCLSLGYQGKYAQPEQNPRELEHIKDNLYVLIQRIRGAASSTLFVRCKTNVPLLQFKPKRRWTKFSHPVAAATLLVVGLLAIYLPYSVQLKKLAEPLNNKISQLAQIADNPIE